MFSPTLLLILNFMFVKISQRVLEMLRSETFVDKLAPECIEVSPARGVKVHPHGDSEFCVHACLDKGDDPKMIPEQDKSKSNNKPFELYKRRTTIVVRRKVFLDVVCEALTEYKYMGPNQRADLVLACR